MENILEKQKKHLSYNSNEKVENQKKETMIIWILEENYYKVDFFNLCKETNIQLNNEKLKTGTIL